jgi:pimeloyl-ACP methyl ester carboxylesterase
MTPHLGEMVAPVSFAPVAFVEVAGLRLHFQQWGQSSARSGVVLVHGLGSSSHIWDLVAPILAEGDTLRVVALDQRGHGESDQPDSGYDFGSVVGDLAGFVEALGLA